MKQTHFLLTSQNLATGEMNSVTVSLRGVSAQHVDAAKGLIHKSLDYAAKHVLAPVSVTLHHRDLPSAPPEVELIDTETLMLELLRRSNACVIGVDLMGDSGDGRVRMGGNLVTCLGLGYQIIRQVQDAIDRSSSTPNQSNQQEESND